MVFLSLISIPINFLLFIFIQVFFPCMIYQFIIVNNIWKRMFEFDLENPIAKLIFLQSHNFLYLFFYLLLTQKNIINCEFFMKRYDIFMS